MTVRSAYLSAFDRIWAVGYSDDVYWARSLADVRPTPTYVMRESAHVICCSGFRVAVVQKLWPEFSAAFCGWDVPAIVRDVEACWEAARRVYHYGAKVTAICEVAQIIDRDGIEQIVEDAKDPPKLTRLPFIGPVTCWHLAKVLGADVIKPDVHLQRAAAAAGYDTALALCEAIRGDGDDPTCNRLTVIDSVLWRYGEQQKARGWPSWTELFGGERTSKSPRRGAGSGPAASVRFSDPVRRHATRAPGGVVAGDTEPPAQASVQAATGGNHPNCPGPDCLMCAGEVCLQCGAGLSTRHPDAPHCDHDVIDRHREAATAGTLPLPGVS